MNNNGYQQYEIFNQHRQALAKLSHQHLEVLSQLDMETWAEKIRTLEQRVLAENFKVLVIGEFKRGKSTFINALLRSEVLPAYATPCTAIINEVKWGEQRRALLHYRATGKDTAKKPREVPVDRLEEYVVIKDFNNKEKEVRENPYEKVELSWPLEICRNGVEIIDSPGLNENGVREKVTMDYLGNADAVLFVVSCEALGPSMSEHNTISNLHATGHKDIFFICNRFDSLNSDKDREMIKRYGIEQFAPLTERGTERIFFISAWNALEGYLQGDQARIEKSGLLPLEKSLEKFLATERGRIKILRPARELQNAIHEARRVIPERESMLRTDVATLQSRYEDSQKPLAELETKRQQIVSRVLGYIEDLRLGVREQARSFYHEVAQTRLYEWAESYELENRIRVRLEWPKAQVEVAVNEIVSHLTTRIEGEFATWQQQTLHPFLEDGVRKITHELDADTREFLRGVDAVRLNLTAGRTDVQSVQLDDVHISPLERILAAAGGLLLGDFVTAGVGAAFGYKAMITSLIQQIAIVAATVVLVGFNPLVLIAAMVAGGLIQSVMRLGSINDKIKRKVAEELAQNIQQTSYQQSEEIAEAVAVKLYEVKDAIDEGLGNEIANVRQQVNSILTEKQKGQTNVEQKLRELQALNQQLDAIDHHLDDLISKVALA